MSAPRLDSRLVAAVARLDRSDRAIAETHRRLGPVADLLGVPRPSYQQVRVVIHELRSGNRGPGAGALLLDATLRTRPAEALFELFV